MHGKRNLKIFNRSARPAPASRCACFLIFFAVLGVCLSARSQSAQVGDAWWTYQQDCNGDGCKAGTLPGNMARLNWTPQVEDCNGTLSVFEIVYRRACGTTSWSPIYTNSIHSITGCRTLGEQSLNVVMASGCACREYKIEIYQPGQSVPDDYRSVTNDPDLGQHQEQLLSEDFCLSDFFATCASLSGRSGTEVDENTYATKEPGEPNHAGNAGGRSLWYCWTAPTNTPVTFDTSGSTFDTLLAVYTGSSISNQVVITSNDDIAGWTNRQSHVTFTPTTGTTYHIAVDGFGGGSGIVVLNWNQTGGNLPDLIIWGPAASPTVITRTFTNTDCEVVEGCENEGEHRLLSFTTETRNIGSGDLIMGDPSTNALFIWASCHEHYHFEQFAEYDLLDTNQNIVATGHKVGFCLEDVRQWSPTANPHTKYTCSFQGIQAGWADVYNAGLPCQYIDVSAVPPGNYVLQMTVNPDNILPESDTANNVTLVPVNIPPLDCISNPVDDSFTNAIVCGPQMPFSVSVFNNCATKEPSEPNHVGNSGGHSVWFDWTALSNQTATVTTKASDFDTLLAVYTGPSVNSLTRIATNDDIATGSILQSAVTFSALAGTTYHIAVDGWGGAVGTVVLNVNPPGNDDFSKAFVLLGRSGTTNGSNIGGSKQPSEPAHASDVGGHSVWYQWTAPSNGVVDFNTLGSTFNTTLAVYVGTNVTNLVLVAANDDDVGGVLNSRVDFFASGGTNYKVAIDGFGGDIGNTTLNWNMDTRLGITEIPGEGVQVKLTGVEWQRYVLLSSSNLNTWTTNVLPVTLYGGVHEFPIIPGSNTPPGDYKFFRALRLP